MGYFSNGTEGDIYEAQYCARCVHNEDDPDKPGCPVMLAHVLYAYEECNSKSNAKHILDELIPYEKGFNRQCAMFITVDTVRQKRQKRADRQLPMFPCPGEPAASGRTGNAGAGSDARPAPAGTSPLSGKEMIERFQAACPDGFADLDEVGLRIGRKL